MNSLMLVDTASLYFRAFYGLPSTLRSPEGEPVNAVRGLLDFLARLITDQRPSSLVCCWDNDWRPGWRVDLLPSYKTHRVAEDASAVADIIGAGGTGAESGQAEEAPDELGPQVPVIAEVLQSLQIPIQGVDGYEADDVIGSLASQADRPVDVVTGDRDLFQLVDDAEGIRVIYTARGMSRLAMVDEAWIRDKYGISASQYADFASLRGDPSDGIPGVSGIGEKTAASLLSTYGDLNGILAAASDPDSALTTATRRKFAAAIDYLGVAGEVVRVARDLQLPAPPPLPGPPGAAFDALAERWGLGSSADRIRTALGATAD
ncbi:5'-3' exonuclease [Naumannella halotolerans]|uniref:5'-3' exonuclease n=1 Tax=Naumannella halotolerans TaxID=993414 RepID=A0A4R7JAH0_9ACTN|nr:5'-3' exonuclease [Naumannella halotolerans]TDT33389.1 5'-3' exonuclease [Naumannella halotolerans]